MQDHRVRGENIAPAYYDAIADVFARRIKILLSHTPVNRHAVDLAVESFMSELAEYEANGMPLMATTMDKRYAGYLEKKGISTDRQLSKLTFDQLVNLSNNDYATGIRREMVRLGIAIHATSNCEARGRHA